MEITNHFLHILSISTFLNSVENFFLTPVRVNWKKEWRTVVRFCLLLLLLFHLFILNWALFARQSLLPHRLAPPGLLIFVLIIWRRMTRIFKTHFILEFWFLFRKRWLCCFYNFFRFVPVRNRFRMIGRGRRRTPLSDHNEFPLFL